MRPTGAKAYSTTLHAKALEMVTLAATTNGTKGSESVMPNRNIDDDNSKVKVSLKPTKPSHNPFVSRDAKIAELEREIARLRDDAIMKQAVALIGENIMTILATIPFSDWPSLAKVALRHADAMESTAVRVYLNNLPNKRIG